MRRVCLLVVLLAAFSSSLAAQVGSGTRGSFPGCPKCGVWSWVDYPAPDGTISLDSPWVLGWGGECVSGQPVDRIEVWYQDYEGAWQPTKQPRELQFFGLGPRTDVGAFWKRAGCANDDNTGWAIYLKGVPLGLRRLRFVIWYRDAYHEAHERTYLVKR